MYLIVYHQFHMNGINGCLGNGNDEECIRIEVCHDDQVKSIVETHFKEYKFLEEDLETSRDFRFSWGIDMDMGAAILFKAETANPKGLS